MIPLCPLPSPKLTIPKPEPMSIHNSWGNGYVRMYVRVCASPRDTQGWSVYVRDCSQRHELHASMQHHAAAHAAFRALSGSRYDADQWPRGHACTCAFCGVARNCEATSRPATPQQTRMCCVLSKKPSVLYCISPKHISTAALLSIVKYLAPSAECRQGLLVLPLASSHCG